MTRRLLGVILCVLLLSAATFDTYAETVQSSFSAIFEFETSFISLDSLDDFSDSTFPGRTMEWSPREKVNAKLMLATTPRKIRFSPARAESCEVGANSRQAFLDLFRFQEVYRI